MTRGRQDVPAGADSPPDAGVEPGEALKRIATRVEALPWNGRGADKTWVLRSMWSALVLGAEIRRATRVRD